MSDSISTTSRRLADDLLADLKSGKLPKIGKGEVEYAVRNVVSEEMDRQLYRDIVDATIRRVVESV